MKHRSASWPIAFAFLLAIAILALQWAWTPQAPTETGEDTSGDEHREDAEQAVASVPDDLRRAIVASGFPEALDPSRPASAIDPVVGMIRLPARAVSMQEIRVIVSEPVSLSELNGELNGNPESALVTDFSPRTDGFFLFWIPSGRASVSVSAVGAYCAAHDDLLASAGDILEIQMGFLYGADIRVVDKGSGELLDRTGFASFSRSVSNHSYLDPCTSGIWSELARDRYPIVPSGKLPRPSTRHLLWSSNYYEGGIRAQLHISEPGIKPASSIVHIPLLTEEWQCIDVPVEVESVAGLPIYIEVDRPGDWLAVAECEYASVARLRILSSSSDSVEPVTKTAPLRPGRHELLGVSLPDPILRLELATQFISLRNFPGRVQTLSMLQNESGESGLVAYVDSSSICAIYVLPQKQTEGTHAWLGMQLVDSTEGDQIGYRYSPSIGFVIDGVLPGKYKVYWAPDLTSYKAAVSSNLPVEVIELVSGLRQIVLP